ncbi:hypothetical protein [Rhodococcus erythropolis]|uniref:hypothetical protein n=1 Tax=Rhodococcus erythropolis TaxID=1833 RepID=UPI000362FC44|nr:hypothetical protein [Rhodococcus erythropolis]
MSRNFKRDARGRFARSGGSIAGAAAGAAIGGALGSKAMRKRYVSGSLQDHSRIGTSADGKFTGAKVGAVYRVPGGRQILVKGSIAVSQKPNAKTKVRVSSDLKNRTGSVKVTQSKPSKPRASTKSAGSKVSTGAKGRARRATSARGSSSGRKVGR